MNYECFRVELRSSGTLGPNYKENKNGRTEIAFLDQRSSSPIEQTSIRHFCLTYNQSSTRKTNFYSSPSQSTCQSHKLLLIPFQFEFIQPKTWETEKWRTAMHQNFSNVRKRIGQLSRLLHTQKCRQLILEFSIRHFIEQVRGIRKFRQFFAQLKLISPKIYQQHRFQSNQHISICIQKFKLTNWKIALNNATADPFQKFEKNWNSKRKTYRALAWEILQATTVESVR